MNCKTPITYYGGKISKLNILLPMVPPHTIYTESFAGGAALFFAKEKVRCEVINDVNDLLINFYRVVQTDFPALKKEIDASLHSRSLFRKAKYIYGNPDDFSQVEKAWAVWYLCKLSFAATMQSFGSNSRGDFPIAVKYSKENFTEHLVRRLENATIESKDGYEVIRRFDKPGAFHFIDPPYLYNNCGHYSGCFDENKLVRLLDLLAGLSGKFLLTMYPNDILNEYISKCGWNHKTNCRTINIKNDGRKGRRQQELFVTNY